MCFHEFLTFQGGILSFSRALSDCLCTTPCTCCDSSKGVNIPIHIFNLLMRGVIFDCFSYSSIWESILTLGEFYELYGV
jgi:hypothetical protein